MASAERQELDGAQCDLVACAVVAPLHCSDVDRRPSFLDEGLSHGWDWPNRIAAKWLVKPYVG